MELTIFWSLSARGVLARPEGGPAEDICVDGTDPVAPEPETLVVCVVDVPLVGACRTRGSRIQDNCRLS